MFPVHGEHAQTTRHDTRITHKIARWQVYVYLPVSFSAVVADMEQTINTGHRKITLVSYGAHIIRCKPLNVSSSIMSSHAVSNLMEELSGQQHKYEQAFYHEYTSKTQSTELNVQTIMLTITQKSFRPVTRPASAAPQNDSRSNV